MRSNPWHPGSWRWADAVRPQLLDKSDKLRCNTGTGTLVLTLASRLVHWYWINRINCGAARTRSHWYWYWIHCYTMQHWHWTSYWIRKIAGWYCTSCTGSPSLGHNSLKMCAMRNAHIALYWNLLHWGDVPVCSVVWWQVSALCKSTFRWNIALEYTIAIRAGR